MDREENRTQTISERIDPCPPDPHTIDRLLGGTHHDPHSVLGAHPHADGTLIRVLRPHADQVEVVREGGKGVALARVHDSGLFSGVVPGPPADYRLAVRYGDRVDVVDDPYRWLPTLGEVDLHLIGEGRHERLWDVLGAHVRRYDTPSGPVTGTSFAVWAPTAQGVRVTGDFDGWSGWAHPMRVLGSSGVWELFVPGIEPGTRYKFRILGRDGRWRDKADPLAFRTEVPPATASVVDASEHVWGDEEWMAARALRQAHAEPMSVYEVHLGSWRQGLGYRELAQQLADYLDETGFTHVELLPVAEHPFGGSWGYQVTSYYAPTARFGTPDDFRYFVDHLHQRGYGVIVDWVPAHFPRDEWALARFDGTPLYEHADPRRGEQPDWGTLVFDFGRREVRNFLVANALYWLDEFHIDGLRVDAVASMLYLDYSRPEGQWLPNVHGGRENLDAVAFLQEMNATVYRNHPGVVTIAEESTAWPGVTRPTHLGGLGFGFKWNMGWMHDTLDYAGRDPIYRAYHHNQMTFSLMYAFSENFVLPLSHDEVVHGKGSLWQRMPGDAWNKSAQLRALLAYMWAHPGKQLLFQGGEFGQEREWSEARSIDWHLLQDPLHGGVKTLIGDLNRTYRDTPALWTKDTTPEGFSWIDANDASGNVLSFLRHGVDADGRPTVLACIANFSGSPKRDYRVGLPFAGQWREVLNTDAQVYGGSGVGNLGAVEAERTMWHGRPASAVLQLPPAGVLWLVPDPGAGAVRRRAVASAEESGPAPATGPTADEPDLTAEVPTTDAPERPAPEAPPIPEPAPTDSASTPAVTAEAPARRPETAPTPEPAPAAGALTPAATAGGTATEQALATGAAEPGEPAATSAAPAREVGADDAAGDTAGDAAGDAADDIPATVPGPTDARDPEPASTGGAPSRAASAVDASESAPTASADTPAAADAEDTAGDTRAPAGAPTPTPAAAEAPAVPPALTPETAPNPEPATGGSAPVPSGPAAGTAPDAPERPAPTPEAGGTQRPSAVAGPPGTGTGTSAPTVERRTTPSEGAPGSDAAPWSPARAGGAPSPQPRPFAGGSTGQSGTEEDTGAGVPAVAGARADRTDDDSSTAQ